MEKSCFSDESHFKVHGRRSLWLRSVGEPFNIPLIFYSPRNSPKENILGLFHF